MERYEAQEIKSLDYNVIKKEFTIWLYKWALPVYAKVNEIHSGGNNCEIVTLKAGSRISFDYTGSRSTRAIKNITVVSDGVREVDSDGNLISW